MLTVDSILKGYKMKIFEFDAVVIGTGCAGFNAADSLYDLDYKEIAFEIFKLYFFNSSFIFIFPNFYCIILHFFAP